MTRRVTVNRHRIRTDCTWKRSKKLIGTWSREPSHPPAKNMDGEQEAAAAPSQGGSWRGIMAGHSAAAGRPARRRRGGGRAPLAAARRRGRGRESGAARPLPASRPPAPQQPRHRRCRSRSPTCSAWRPCPRPTNPSGSSRSRRTQPSSRMWWWRSSRSLHKRPGRFYEAAGSGTATALPHTSRSRPGAPRAAGLRGSPGTRTRSLCEAARPRGCALGGVPRSPWPRGPPPPLY